MPFTVRPAFSILYRMNYSREWQKHLNYYNSLTQKYDWDYVVREKELTDPKNDKAENLVIRNNPVWAEIHDVVGDKPFSKIKAISKYNAYFDGTYVGLTNSLSLGCLHSWDYTIDGHTLELNYAREEENNQEKLIEFLRLYSDAFIPPVPKGILKIPTFI